MKKILKTVLSLTLVFSLVPYGKVSAKDEDEIRKERILSYVMYSIVSDDNTVEVNESIAHLSYEEIHAKIEERIIDKLNPKEGDNIIWDPEFVLELVPIEFPDLYDELYDALIQQGYNSKEGTIGEVEFESAHNLETNTRNEVSTYSTTYSRSYSYTYESTGYGTMIISRSDLKWTLSGSTINITYAKANYLGGWSLIFANASNLDNNSSNAFGFFSYNTLESPLLYEAYLQVQIKPSTTNPGSSIAKILTEGVNLTSGYFPK